MKIIPTWATKRKIYPLPPSQVVFFSYLLLSVSTEEEDERLPLFFVCPERLCFQKKNTAIDFCVMLSESCGSLYCIQHSIFNWISRRVFFFSHLVRGTICSTPPAAVAALNPPLFLLPRWWWYFTDMRSKKSRIFAAFFSFLFGCIKKNIK